MAVTRKRSKSKTPPDLMERITKLRRDFETHGGLPCRHFFCPKLRRDENTEFIRGHIINEKFGNCDVWIPQRKDVDNFYGSVAEADFVAIIEDRGKEPIDILIDPCLNRRHRPHFEVEGRHIDHYLTPAEAEPVPGHTRLEVQNEDGIPISSITLKVPSDELAKLPLERMKLIFEKDFRLAVIASVLKAAHLTLFLMLGYRYVFSPSGFYLSHILAEFFFENQDIDRATLRKNLEKYFHPFSRMVIPIVLTGSWQMEGTLLDNRAILCFGSSGAIFAMGVIVRARDAAFCVFLPDDVAATMNTYFSFLKEPPQSVAVRLAEWSNGDKEMAQPHWNVAAGEPKRVPMPTFS